MPEEEFEFPIAPMAAGATLSGPPHLPEDFGETSSMPMTIGDIKATLENAPTAKIRFETALVRRRLFGMWAQEVDTNVARSVWLELLKEML